MDDDLRSLMNRSDNDDDLFGSFTDPDDLGFDAASPFEERAGDLDDFDFSDPFAVSAYDEPVPAAPPPPPAATVRAAKAPRPAKPKKRRPRAKTGFLGMTAPQRMVLAIFLFLDVAVIGLLVLLAIGAINFNF